MSSASLRGRPRPLRAVSLNVATSSAVNTHCRPIFVPMLPVCAYSLNRVTLIPINFAASLVSIKSITSFYHSIIKNKFVVDNGLLFAIMELVTFGNGFYSRVETIALLVFNRIIRLSRYCGAVASFTETIANSSERDNLESTTIAAVFLPVAREKNQ